MKNERQVAILILTEINQDGAYNNIALRRALDQMDDWQPRQKAFVTELVNGTLRNMILIDHIIASFSRNKDSNKGASKGSNKGANKGSNKASKMKPFITELLRTAIYQIRWMDKVPNSAAVNEAVKLARANGFDPLSGFINGILRNIVRAHEAGTFNPWEAAPHQKDFACAGRTPGPGEAPSAGDADMASYLGLRYSYPNWLARRLIKWMGFAAAEEFCAASHVTPSVTICVNTQKVTRDDLIESLEDLDIICTKSDATDTCIHLKRAGRLSASESYKKGHFFVMDENSYLAAAATGAMPGQTIIDLCAAPGGKSFAIAGLMQDSGRIISCDIHPHKVDLIKRTTNRLSLRSITVQESDAAIQNTRWENIADAVLLDAPCSGFGVIQKRPDIKYTKKMQDIIKLAEFQKTLLAAAAAYVKPGGTLVYSTCTITTEENEDNISWFLENFPYVLDGPFVKPRGFFIARLIRK